MSDSLPEPDELDPISLAGTKAKGKRPRFLDNQDAERVLSVTMAVAAELAVLRQRMDTIEEVLTAKGSLTKSDIEAFTPTREQADARGQWTQEFIARILRIVQQEREAGICGEEESSEEVGNKLAQI